MRTANREHDSRRAAMTMARASVRRTQSRYNRATRHVRRCRAPRTSRPPPTPRRCARSCTGSASAAPYVHAFRGKTFVIAFGGEVVADDAFLGVVHDLNLLHSLGIRLVVVARLPAAGRGDPRRRRAFRAATRTACASPTPTRWTACSKPPARCARASRRCCRSGSRTRRWPARATACRAATTSPPSRWASSTASTCSSPAKCAASTPRRSSSAWTTATSC